MASLVRQGTPVFEGVESDAALLFRHVWQRLGIVVGPSVTIDHVPPFDAQALGDLPDEQLGAGTLRAGLGLRAYAAFALPAPLPVSLDARLSNWPVTWHLLEMPGVRPNGSLQWQLGLGASVYVSPDTAVELRHDWQYMATSDFATGSRGLSLGVVRTC